MIQFHTGCHHARAATSFNVVNQSSVQRRPGERGVGWAKPSSAASRGDARGRRAREGLRPQHVLPAGSGTELVEFEIGRLRVGARRASAVVFCFLLCL